MPNDCCANPDRLAAQSQGPVLDIFRLARPADVDAILAFTQSAEAGLTTVPRTRERVIDYIDATQAFLSGDQSANRVLFVVERGGRVMGISGIIPVLGLDRPFYSFKRSRHAGWSPQLDLRNNYETLQLTTDFDGYTELASIFLAPEARGKGVARLLSLGRLAFIEQHRSLFSDRLMADIRGWVDDNGVSPFWRHLTSEFIQTDFDVADRLSTSDGRFIMELMPSLPIFLNLLPEAARHCAGRPHDISRGAMNLLIGAGFEPTDLCDIFDGGPAIQCRIDATLIARTQRKVDKSADLSGGGKTQRVIAFAGDLSGFKATMTRGDLTSASVDVHAADLGEDVKICLASERRR